MGHRYVTLPFSATVLGAHREEDGHGVAVEVGNGVVVSEVDLRTGAVGTAVRLPTPATRAPREWPPVVSGLEARIVETPEGPRTVLFDPRRESSRVELEGELVRAVRERDVVVALVSVLDDRYDLVVASLGSREELRFPSTFDVELTTGGGYAIAATPSAGYGPQLAPHAHVVRTADARVTTIGVGSAVRIVGSEAWLLGADALHVVDLASLPFPARHAAVPIAFAALERHTSGLDAPATIVMLLPSTILADHPRVGRLNIPRAPTDPPVSVGDAIRIDEIHEPLPGVRKVLAWSRGGAPASVRPAAAPRELAAPTIGPIGRPDARDRPRQTNREIVERELAKWGATPPASLIRFLEAADVDPLLRRWLGSLGLATIEVRELSSDWDADPCLLAFAGRGNGDEHALYVYPPAIARGELPIVEYLHETGFSEHSAPSFDAFLAKLLAEGHAHAPDAARLVASRLGTEVPIEAPARAPTPSWIVTEETRVPWAEVEALRTRGDLLHAERGYLAHYLARGDHSSAARAALVSIYASLGWLTAREVLERSGQDT